MRWASPQIRTPHVFDSVRRLIEKCMRRRGAVSNIPAREKTRLDSSQSETPTLVDEFAGNLRGEVEP